MADISEDASAHIVDSVLKDSSEIQNFYNGTSIFITGGSGFLGSLLIEKLLRTCPGVIKIYLLMREKKGKSTETRFKELFSDVVFEPVLKKQPNCLEKVSIVAGECALPGLGLSVEDRNMLINNVNVVFHMAATVNFTEKLRLATAINVRGTLESLLLAKEILNLKTMIYVSTAYAHCIYSDIDEKFYDTPVSSDELIQLTNILNDDQLDALLPHLMGKWPNTYVFTKAIAEDIVKTEGKDLPIAIVRPSIIRSTYKEPIIGWINNLYGIVGITLGSGIGLIRTLHCDPNTVVDIVPADYCVNIILAAAWDSGKRKKNPAEKSSVDLDDIISDDISIYNYVGSVQKPITYRQYMTEARKAGITIPSPHCLWYYCLSLHKNKYMHLLSVIFLHFLPGYIVDFCCWISGSKLRLMKTYKKIHKLSNAISYFCLRQFNFSNRNVLALWDKLSDTDKRLFEFDMNLFNFEADIFNYMSGIRIYLMKDPMETLPSGLRKYKKLKIIHYTVVTISRILLLTLLWTILSTLYNTFF